MRSSAGATRSPPSMQPPEGDGGEVRTRAPVHQRQNSAKRKENTEVQLCPADNPLSAASLNAARSPSDGVGRHLRHLLAGSSVKKARNRAGRRARSEGVRGGVGAVRGEVERARDATRPPSSRRIGHLDGLIPGAVSERKVRGGAGRVLHLPPDPSQKFGGWMSRSLAVVARFRHLTFSEIF